MHLIIAPNTFKHSLSAFAVAEAIKTGLQQSKLAATYTLFPIADGGEGITDILVQQLNGRLVPATVQDALGRNINTSFGLIKDDQVAVVELARASGLRWLQKHELNPLQASTFGTGQLIKQALDLGCRQIIMGLGNSATVDGGVGLLQALGVKFLDNQGQSIGLGAQGLLNLQSIDLTALDERLLTCNITVACDVENPLLGPKGAAQVFGPQKGANPETVLLLEQGLNRLNQVLKAALNKDMADWVHGGAAGGTAATLAAVLNADLVPGVNYLLDLTGFNEALANADLLITAEGGLDEQTLAGKGPYGVARHAQEKNIPVIALAGQIPANLNLALFEYFNAVFPIGTGPVSLEDALAHTTENLTRTAWQIGNLLQLNLRTC
ncbi:glycerate kinase family protein [Adhaeribacter rhizoryzae]|uniref:Glycerate kinase n=1 Tax=Adhaeribacter rhizoryzae TaxID=2607907 RepID=A0A5M6DEL2_9BACT|nr:glycerate kinase [Adhaeribacter rhizoryzae]KAA5544830.1 glycerate kinase [Adhaeribacter rhizoryzae]